MLHNSTISNLDMQCQQITPNLEDKCLLPTHTPPPHTHPGMCAAKHFKIPNVYQKTMHVHQEGNEIKGKPMIILFIFMYAEKL